MRTGTLIIGGGAIGLSLAWRLAQRGERVTVLERQETGREASWAATGLLTSVAEINYQAEASFRLGLESLERYPEFVAGVEEASGMTVDFRTEGSLAIALSEDETPELQHQFDYQTGQGFAVQWLDGPEVLKLEPNLTPSVTAGVFRPRDRHIDTRLLMPALKAAAERAGADIREHSEVTRVELADDGPPAVHTAQDTWQAERVVLCAGSWSGRVPGLAEALGPLVRPVKGQVMALTAPDAGFIRHPLRTPNLHLTPKSDLRLVLGATMEEVGYDRDVTAGAVAELLHGATRAVPTARNLPVQGMWCGFRPATRDGSPIMGGTDIPGLYLSTGHFRHGIVHTPAAAALMCGLLLDGEQPELLQNFALARFGAG